MLSLVTAQTEGQVTEEDQGFRGKAALRVSAVVRMCQFWKPAWLKPVF